MCSPVMLDGPLAVELSSCRIMPCHCRNSSLCRSRAVPSHSTIPIGSFEPKHDGFRCIAYVEYGRCRLVFRNGNEFKSFGSLNAAIADELKEHSAVIDSEIVSLDDEGKSQFYELLFHRGEPRPCAFDLLHENYTEGL